ncbi:MAG: response regulator with putative antiterminator output domain [Acidimicrobiales bacterium]|nr:response regulator with putative antiterminator output domain [Acidimicrobiales bacterium]
MPPTCARCVELSSEVGQLREAIVSRDVIGQAKGVLMATHRVTADAAFQMLVRASQRLNVKVRQVAEEVAATGALPDAPPISRSAPSP